MDHSKVVNYTDHRLWPLPSTPWVMRQTWNDLLFAHWPIPIEVMRALVPPQMVLDTYDGVAWVGVVPFGMMHVAPRGFPDMPWLSAFPELNVRTYVTSPAPPGADPAVSKPGVYFFSLEAANPVAVTIARQLFKLPYFNARMNCETRGEAVDYTSHRTHRNAPPADFVGSYAPTGEVYRSRPGTLDHWLTERYCLYTTHGDKLFRGEIHHMQWPLQPATAEITTNTMAAASGITLPAQAPLLHFARRIDMVAWPLTVVN
jgi:uncharacterized protein YqjF (DUF2071 family)